MTFALLRSTCAAIWGCQGKRSNAHLYSGCHRHWLQSNSILRPTI